MIGLPEQRDWPAEMADKPDDMVLAPPSPNASPFAAAETDSPSAVDKVALRLTSLPGGLVDGGEVVLLAIKPSMWRPFFDSAAWIVTLTMLAIVTTIWELALPGLTVSTSAQLILVLALLRFGLAIFAWIPSWYVLTNRRLIEIHGVRTPDIAACSLLEVRNTYFNTTPIEKAARLGTITYVTADETEAPHYWRSISEPQLVHTEIRRAIENAIDNQHAS